MKTRNEKQRADFEIILQNGAIGSTRFPSNIWLQPFEHQIFIYYRVYLLQDIELAGYVANHFDLKQKSTMHKIKLHIKSNFDIDKTLIALKVKVKVIAWPFYPITLKKTEWQFSFAFQIELKGFQIWWL